MRLPSTVVCCGCRKRVPTSNTRRLITLWARPGKGGSLSGIKDQSAKDVYRCDTCVRDGVFAPADDKQGAML